MKKESFSVWFLYCTLPGHILLKVLTWPVFSYAAGLFLDSGMSKWLIPGFIRRHNISMEAYEEKEYRSFNDFFIRKKKPEESGFDSRAESLISPCDGYLSAYPIDSERIYQIKHVGYCLGSLLKDHALAERYREGICLIFRLTPQNYHRYCYIDNGRIKRRRIIRGILHCVRPIASETYPVYIQNSREYTVIKTENFGTVVQMEVGALLVGRIRNHQKEGKICRGEEKGYFEFGGSTIILLFERGRISLTDKGNAGRLPGRETAVKMGEKIGMKQTGQDI